MAKGRKKKTIVSKKKAIGSAITGTELRTLMQNGKISIGLNTYYQLYADNTDLRAGIRKIASKMGVKGFFLQDDNEKVVHRPQLKKAIKKIFSDPERGLKNFIAFKLEMLKHFFIGGEIYLLPIFNGLGHLLNFQILDPRTITKVYNNEGEIIRYEQRSEVGGKVKKIDADKLAFYKLENDPKNPVNGLSLLYSVVWDTLTDSKAVERNYYFFENDKVPRSVLQLSDEYDYSDVETKVQLKNLKDSLNGSDKAHKMLASNLVKDIKILEMNNKDMEFVNQRKLTTDKVGALLGIPKTQLGYSDDINFATAQQFYADFIEGTIKTNQVEFDFIYTDALKRFTTNFESLNIVLETDDTVNIYKEHEDQRSDLDSGVRTVDEIRDERGYEKIKIEPVEDED